jgi:uncharacterized repeat protein (TIGR03803 family)
VTTDGVLTTLVSFADTNGASPSGSLVLGSDGAFYGTTSSGGPQESGTVFRLTTNGVLTTLASFSGTNGRGPAGPLCIGTDGALYGTCSRQGSLWGGNVFRLELGSQMGSLSRTNGGWVVGFTGLPEDNYQVQRAPSPAGPWGALGQVAAGADGLGHCSDTNAPAGSAFYRVSSPLLRAMTSE